MAMSARIQRYATTGVSFFGVRIHESKMTNTTVMDRLGRICVKCGGAV
jgi:hypothetical protein